MLDLSAPEYDKARRMLETDIIAWFTTVDADGAPHAVPVWFFWHEGRIVVFSQPHTVKVQHVKAGSPVLVHLQAGGPEGDDVVILSGSAEAHDGAAGEWLAKYADAYAAKYADAIEAFGMPAEAITDKYSTALVLTPENILAW
jgi:PPOX class probable F420-dependent enzyme